MYKHFKLRKNFTRNRLYIVVLLGHLFGFFEVTGTSVLHIISYSDVWCKNKSRRSEPSASVRYLVKKYLYWMYRHIWTEVHLKHKIVDFFYFSRWPVKRGREIARFNLVGCPVVIYWTQQVSVSQRGYTYFFFYTHTHTIISLYCL